MQAQVLQKNKQRILKGLSWFEAPNAKSAAIIKSGQATWRDKSLKIDKTQQEFVLQLSEAMVRKERGEAISNEFLRLENRPTRLFSELKDSKRCSTKENKRKEEKESNTGRKKRRRKLTTICI